MHRNEPAAGARCPPQGLLTPVSKKDTRRCGSIQLYTTRRNICAARTRIGHRALRERRPPPRGTRGTVTAVACPRISPLSFPSTAGASSARLPTRHTARTRSRAPDLRSGPLHGRRPTGPPTSSCPDVPTRHLHGAARGRVLRTCGPALFMADASPKIGPPHLVHARTPSWFRTCSGHLPPPGLFTGARPYGWPGQARP